MGEISKKATAVLAWFGRKTSEMEVAFKLVRDLAERYNNYGRPHTETERKKFEHEMKIVGRYQWKAFRQLLEARWLKRM